MRELVQLLEQMLAEGATEPVKPAGILLSPEHSAYLLEHVRSLQGGTANALRGGSPTMGFRGNPYLLFRSLPVYTTSKDQPPRFLYCPDDALQLIELHEATLVRKRVQA